MAILEPVCGPNCGWLVAAFREEVIENGLTGAGVGLLDTATDGRLRSLTILGLGSAGRLCVKNSWTGSFSTNISPCLDL